MNLNPFKKREEETEDFYKRNSGKKIDATILMPTAEELKKQEVGL